MQGSQPPRFLTARWIHLAMASYEGHHGAWSRLRVTIEGEAYLPDETSEAAFITEHYWGYTVQRDGSTLEYKVEHPRWNVWRCARQELVCNAAALYGSAFAPCLAGEPSSCFVADGSEIVVRRGTRCEPT